MTTKDAYLLEALRLFAEKGYEATSVAEIAKAVGCTTSALYKHFPGKKALFDAIVERSQSGFRENMAFFHICADDPQDRKRVLSMTVEDHVQLMRRIFDSITLNEYPRLFRKLITVEQFRHPELSEIYEEHYIRNQVRSFAAMMQIRIDGGLLKPADPQIMAMQYIAPVILMTHIFDRAPERKAELTAALEQHVRQFNKVYGEEDV